jgi:hypothetical protein
MDEQIMQSIENISRRFGGRWKFLKYFIAATLLFFAIQNATAFHDRHDFYATGGADFKIYRTAAEILNKGQSGKLYDYVMQLDTQRKLYPIWPITNGPLPYNHPAAEALLFLPLAGMDVVKGSDRWLMFNVILLLLSFWLLRHELSALNRKRILPPVLWAAAFFPVIMGFFLGQDAIVMLFLYTTSFVLSRRGQDHWSGLAVGLCTFKPHLALPFAFLFFLCRRRWSGLAGFLLGGTAMGIFSLALVGINGMKDFLVLNASTQEFRPWLFNARLMPQVRGVIQTTLQGWLSYRQTVGVIILVSMFMIIWATRWLLYLPKVRLHSASESIDLEFAFCMIVTILVSFHLYPYDMSMLLVPVLLIINRILAGEIPVNPLIWTIIFAIAFLFFLPIHLWAVANLYYFLFAFVLMILAWSIGKWMIDMAENKDQAFSTSTKQA